MSTGVVTAAGRVIKIYTTGPQGPAGTGGGGGAVASVNTRTGAVVLTSADVGLASVNNTADASKPVSTAQAAADTVVAANASAALSGHTANVANPHSTTAAQVGLGSVDNTSDAGKPVSTAQQTALNLKAPLASPTFTGAVTLPAGQAVNGVTLSTVAGTGAFLRGDGSYAAPAGGGDMVLASAQTVSGAKTYNAATLLLNNVAGTFASLFTNTNTAARTYTLKDASGTVAFVSDITGTNTNTNTGDNATNSQYSGLAASKANVAGDTFTGAITSPAYILSSSGIITDATTARTLSAGDNGKVLYFTNAAAITLTLAASLGAGFACTVVQGAAGQITFAAGGQTMTIAGAMTKTASVGAMASVLAPAANIFFIAGTLA